jgi:hypothetical protein
MYILCTHVYMYAMHLSDHLSHAVDSVLSYLYTRVFCSPKFISERSSRDGVKQIRRITNVSMNVRAENINFTVCITLVPLTPRQDRESLR